MTDRIKKYLPWLLTLVLAALVAWLGTRGGSVTERVVTVVKTDSLTTRDTVRVEKVRARVDVQYYPVIAPMDSTEFNALVAERDSLSNLVLLAGATTATLDTTITVQIGDTAQVTLRLIVQHEVERQLYNVMAMALGANITYHCTCPEASTTWQWVERGVAGALLIISQLIK